MKVSIKRLDDLWSEKIKQRDNFKCVKCGKDKYLNSHHIFSRSKRSTRWYLPNGITLCVGCHTFSSNFSAHKTPAEFIEFVKTRNGEQWYDDLRRQANSIDKNKNDYWLEQLQ